MSYTHAKKHYRAAQKEAARFFAPAGGPAARPAENDFWAEYGPLLMLLLSVVSLFMEGIHIGMRLAKRAGEKDER
ncbi:MAG: hypothetical protein FWC55_06410 [Firmicutes bacterium]|nr:hypothetical protein [Bacillota bacterium]